MVAGGQSEGALRCPDPWGTAGRWGVDRVLGRAGWTGLVVESTVTPTFLARVTGPSDPINWAGNTKEDV